MKIYGYQSPEDETFLTLTEISLDATSEEIRRLAAFFAYVASIMEQSGDKFGHEHFRDFCAREGYGWIAGNPDLIVGR